MTTFAKLVSTWTPDGVTFLFGAVHRGKLSREEAVQASDAWRDDDAVQAVWITDPRTLGAEAIDVTFVYGASIAMASTRPGAAPGKIFTKNLATIERRRREIGNEPVPSMTAADRRAVLGEGEAGWMVLGPPGAVVEIVVGVPATTKVKVPASARVLRSGKTKVAGLPLARVEVGASGRAAVDPFPFAARRTEAEKLFKSDRVQVLVLASPEVVAEGGAAVVPAKATKAASATRPASRRPVATVDEPALLGRLVASMNDSAVDSFGRGIRFVSAERVDEHIVLRYTAGGQPSSANAHWPEALTPKDLTPIEDELASKIVRDTSDDL